MHLGYLVMFKHHINKKKLRKNLLYSNKKKVHLLLVIL
jgi:hypothetical protein